MTRTREVAAGDKVGMNWGIALFWVATGGILLWLAYWAATNATPPKADTEADAAEMLAVVSLVAVGIERVTEGLWSIIGRMKHAWWPLNAFGEAVETLIAESNAAAAPAFDAAEASLKEIKAAAVAAGDTLTAIDAEIQKLETQKDAYEAQFKRISSLARNNERAQLLGALAFQAVNRLDTAYGEKMPAVRKAFNDVSQVATGLQDILAGLKDNPAKKLASIAFGAILGLIVSGVVGLDLFLAAGLPLEPFKVTDTLSLDLLGVALTGLALGLGANPTHEIVKYVSEAAKSRRVGNFSRPNVSGSPDERGEPEAVGGLGFGPSLGRVLSAAAGTQPPSRVSPARVQPGAFNLR